MSKVDRTREVELDGFKFKFYLLDAVSGRKLLVKLMSCVGPALRDAAASVAGSKDPAAIGLAVAGAALSVLTPELVEECMTAFGATEVEINEGGKTRSPRIRDEKDFFAGRYALNSKFLWAGLEFNFGDFLGQSDLLAKLKAAAGS